MKRIAILAAALLGAALFFGCSNSSDTPFIPSSGSSAPAVRITGPNVIASNGTTDVNEPKQTTLIAVPTGYATTDVLKFTWEVTDNANVVTTLDADNSHDKTLTLASIEADATADKEVTVKVTVKTTSATAPKETSAVYKIKILKKTTEESGKVPLKFIEWMPEVNLDNGTGTGAAKTYSVPTATDTGFNPGASLTFVPPYPIYNGYSANWNTAEAKKGWTYTTSNKAIAPITAGGVEQAQASYTDAAGNTGYGAKAVNKTEADATVTLTVSGNYNLGAGEGNQPSFNKSVTYKINKGKKVKVTLTTTTPATFKYGDAAAAASKVLDDVWAGLEYETLAIIDPAASDPKTIATITSISALTGGVATASDNKYKFTVTYVGAPTELTLPIKWSD